MKRSWIRAAALCAAMGMGSAALAEEPAKIHAGLRCANGLLADMEYLTAKLAKQRAVYEKDIQPNIEIFLIGVNPELPVGYSFLFTAETGKRNLLQIPVEDLKNDFIDGNLDPIGIAADKDRKDKTLYELSGDVFTGWMRAKGNNSYASISKERADVPVAVVTPDVTLNAMFAKGYDFAVSTKNTAAEAQTRTAAFQKLKENQLAALKKKADETPEAFDLRTLELTQRLDNLGRLYTNTLDLQVGWGIEEDKQRGLGQMHWTAMPDTDFAGWIAKLGTQQSHFASLSGSDKSVLTARVLLPIPDKQLVGLKEIHKLSPTVLKQQIEANTELNADEKAARIGATEAGIEALNKTLDMGVIDLFVDVAPSGEKAHTFVLGMRSADVRTSIETLVGHLGKVRTGWSSQVNTETVGETKFHSLTVTDAPKTMSDFFGGEGMIHVAAGPDFVAMAFGSGSLDVLKKLAEQATTGEKKALESFVDVRFHARESLDITHAFRKEKKFDFFSTKSEDEPKTGTAEPKSTDSKKDKKPKAGGGKNDAKNILKNFDWQQTALDAMRDTDDLVTMQMKLVDGALDGEIQLGEGVLTGMGAVIAKFALEFLSGK